MSYMYISCHVGWGGAYGVKHDCHNSILKSAVDYLMPQLVHIDYYTAQLVKAGDGCKVYWDVRERAMHKTMHVYCQRLSA